MNNLVFNPLSNAISFLKQLRLERFFIAALAGFLLLVNTACSQTSPPTATRSQDLTVRTADARGSASSSPYQGQAQQQRELYDAVQPRQGGMNGYSDDFKQDSASTKARAEDLINRSKQNLQKRAESPSELRENYKDNPIGEGARDVSKNLGNAANELRENLSEGVQQGSRNVKENAAQFREDAPRVVQQAGRNAQGAANDLRDSAGDLSKGVQRAVGRASEFAQDQS